MKILVVHHNDADGIVSAAVVKYAYQKVDYQNTDFEFKAYGNAGYSNDWDIPALVAGFDKVFVVDFSFPAEKLVEAKQLLGNNFVWIDHHKSALP